MTASTRAVLVVEDEPLIGLDLQQLLQESGYDVVGPARTVVEALECLRGNDLRAALVDLNLGGQLTRDVVHELLDASVPVVLLTGYTIKTNTPPYDACPVVNKPYEPNNLLQVLQDVIDHSQAPDSRVH